MTTTLLVDGTNIAMFASFGGKIDPAYSTSSAIMAIKTAAAKVNAARVMVALDGSTPTFRKQIAPDYKAGRTVKTQPYVDLFRRRSPWPTVTVEGFEADDVLATLATHATERCVIFSSDSDVLALVNARITVLRPLKVMVSKEWFTADVLMKYGVYPEQLPVYKALVGEPGDNIAGIKGIGPKTAVAMIAGGLTDAEQAQIALGLTLTTLRRDVPVVQEEISKQSFRDEYEGRWP